LHRGPDFSHFGNSRAHNPRLKTLEMVALPTSTHTYTRRPRQKLPRLCDTSENGLPCACTEYTHAPPIGFIHVHCGIASKRPTVGPPSRIYESSAGQRNGSWHLARLNDSAACPPPPRFGGADGILDRSAYPEIACGPPSPPPIGGGLGGRAAAGGIRWLSRETSIAPSGAESRPAEAPPLGWPPGSFLPKDARYSTPLDFALARSPRELRWLVCRDPSPRSR